MRDNNSYKSAFFNCPKCGGFIDQDSLLCRKCGYDYEKEMKNEKIRDAKDRDKPKRHS